MSACVFFMYFPIRHKLNLPQQLGERDICDILMLRNCHKMFFGDWRRWTLYTGISQSFTGEVSRELAIFFLWNTEL